MTKIAWARLRAMGTCVPLVWIASLTLVHGAPPQPPEEPKKEETKKTDVFWVDTKGEVSGQVQILEQEWHWEKRLPDAKFETPALRVRIASPLKEGTVEALEPSGLAVVGKYSPGKDLVVDLFTADASLKVRYRTTGKIEEKSLAFVNPLEKPNLIAHKNCAELDFKMVEVIVPGRLAAKNLFFALDCVRNEKQVDFVLSKSRDAKWVFKTKQDRELASKSEVITRTSASESKIKDEKMKEVLRASAEDGSGKPVEIAVHHRPTSWKKTGPPVISAGKGFSILNYEETGVEKLSQMALTLKVTYLRPFFFENWDIAVGGFFTTLVLTSNQANVQARYLGVNGRVGYNFPQIKDPWKLTILGGWYYTSMLVTGDALGYKNLQGPQVFPTARYKFTDRISAFAYVKYAPITMGVSVLNPAQNQEIAAGGGASIVLKGKHSIVPSLDVSLLKITVFGKVIQSTSLSIGANYSYVFAD